MYQHITDKLTKKFKCACAEKLHNDTRFRDHRGTKIVVVHTRARHFIMDSNVINLSSEKDDMKLKSISAIEERLIALLKEGPHTRDQLVKKLAVPRTTIYDGLRKLIIRNEVKKYPLFATDRSRGRPQVLFSLLDSKE